MKKQILLFLFLWCISVFVLKAQDRLIKPTTVIKSVFLGETPPLRDLPALTPEDVEFMKQKAFKKAANKVIKPRLYPYAETALPKGEDQVWQKSMGKSAVTKAPLVNFEGQTTSSFPPDCNGTVGPSHYMQTVNSTYAIYNKSGTLLAGPTNMNLLFNGVSGASCNDGDPLIQYDEQAQRWLAVEFSLCGSNDLMLVAVSSTNDPTGTWYAYSFDVADMPDYEKVGIWQDGYYMGTNTSSGNDIYVMERAKMLQGLPAQMVAFDNSWRPGTGFLCVPPLDNDATFAPAGSPGLFIAFNDDAVAGGTDQLWLYELDVDWVTPANSTFVRSQQINVTAFDSEFNASWDDITQPTAQKLDGVPQVIMNAPQYRNFGTYQTIVCCHTVDVDATDHAGIRWYELRKTPPSTTWVIRQQGTYCPDANSRWMGSIMLNGNGKIGLGYSISSSTIYPGIRYCGQSSAAYASASGILDIPEAVIQNGTVAQTTYNRWGDYSLLSVDPSDDETFWFTSEYVKSGGTLKGTKIASFRFGNNPIVTTNAATSILSTSATLNGTVNPNGLATTYYFEYGLTTSYGSTTTTVSAGSGTSAVAVSANLTGLTIGQIYHFRLVATNSDGNSNGNDLTLTTLGAATVTTTAASTVTTTTAVSGGNVTSDGGSTVTARGVCWGTSVDPIKLSGNYTTDGSGTGVFTSSITGLSPSTVYHVRAYATNANGTYYGNDITFTTLCGVFTLPFTESFLNTTIPNCWTQVDNQGNGQIWQFGTITGESPNPALNGNYAFLNSDAYGSGNSQNANLLTPTLDLSAFSTVNLSFNHYFKSYSGSSGTVSYSINNGTTWTTIITISTTSATNPLAFSQAVNAVAGQSQVKFKWNYTGTWGYYWGIDDINITGTTTNTITTGTIAGSPFCAGTGVSVPFTVIGSFTSGNVFTAQLSDASGSFATPVAIGTLTATTAGTINATLPVSSLSGTAYRIRVVSSAPVANGSANTVNITINKTAAPTGIASQYFCNSATVSNLQATGTGILWYAASSGGTPLSSATSLVNGNHYYASQTLNGCESSARFDVTVSLTTPAPTGSALQSFCYFATVANLQATGSGILWYASSSGGTALSTATLLVNGNHYYASQTLNGCESNVRLNVTVTINNPSTPTGTALQSFCNSATVANLQATGSGILWYAASGGGTPLSTSTSLANGNHYYASQTISGCESTGRFDVTVSIMTPSAPTGTASQTYCSLSTVANLQATGTGILWYAASSGGTALTLGTSLVNGNHYYASQTINGCESVGRFNVTVTINAPAAPTGTATQTFCNAATVSNLQATGSGILWYASSSGGTALTTGTSLVNGNHYYASQTINGCESNGRFDVTVVINSPAPTGNALQSFCYFATVANLQATGSGILWYASSSGGTSLSTSTPLISGDHYYASQTLNGCESITRLDVTVLINNPPTPTGSASQFFCNSSTVANLQATGTGILWYAASGGGTALSTATTLLNGNHYYASQTISGCESTGRFDVTATISSTSAPTGSAIQSFCNSSTLANIQVTGSDILWYAASSGGTALSIATSLVSGNHYYASQTLNGCESIGRLDVAVILNTPAPTGTSIQAFCNSATVANLQATGANILWYSVPSGGTALSTATSLVNGNHYYASQTDNGCESSGRLDVTVTITVPSTPTGTSPQIFCYSGTVATLQATGTGILWYSSSVGGTALSTSTALVNGSHYFATQTVNGCQSTGRFDVTVNIVSPSAPVATYIQYFCNSATVANLQATGTGIKWYANSTGGTALSTSTSLVSNTYYWASQTVNGCESASRTYVYAIINYPIPPTGSVTQTFCNSATIANLQATGTGVLWYAAPSGGIALSSATALADGNHYYASQTINGCESIGRLDVTATINVPPAPTGATTQTICFSGTLADLQATGTGILWYAYASGGTVLSTSTSLINGKHYYASQTINGCESTARLNVGVSIINPPTPTGTILQTFCNSATVAELQATGTGILWYTAPTGGTSLSSSAQLVSTHHYYASQTIFGCESTVRLDVTANVINPSTPSGPTSQSFCNAATVADLQPLGTGIKWYSSLNSTTPLSVSTPLVNGNQYFAGRTLGSCESSTRLNVTVSINIPSIPTGSASQIFCNSATVTNLQATGTGILWYAASSGGPALSDTTSLVNGNHYFASQTINGCESTGRFDVAVEVYTVTPPSIGSITQPTCSIATATVILNNLPATDSWTLTKYPGGTTTVGTGTTTTISGLITGTYNYTVINAGGCTSMASADIVIIQQPRIPITPGTISGFATVCQGQDSVIYTVPLIGLATSYVWTLPSGATGASSTNSIVVNYNTSAIAGNITVNGNNMCGDGPVKTLPITVNRLPTNAGVISGDFDVCQEQNSVSYSVPTMAYATSYVWTLPMGATGTSTTKNITINYGTSAVSGDISVKGHNTCGDGVSRTQAITVNPLPSDAGIISGAVSVCPGQNPVNYSIPVIPNATSYVWTLPSGATASSNINSINVTYGQSAVSGNIMVKGNNTCGDGNSSTLGIMVNPVYSFVEYGSICNGESFIWQGTNYSSAGTYTSNHSSSNGCDSNYTLYLTVKPSYVFTETHSICDGDTYLWRGQILTNAGTYYDNFKTTESCDSIYSLHLIVNPVYNITENHSICVGDSYDWHGQTLTTPGTYMASYQTINRCDSNYTLFLTINPVYNFSETHVICEGDTWSWHGQNLTTEGMYHDTYKTKENCDSIYTLNLRVNPAYNLTEYYSVCLGDSTVWHGQTLTTAGTYMANYQTINGCDSNYTLYLTVKPAYIFTETYSICEGGTYLWHGQNLTTAGTYYDNLKTSENCDSLYSLNLTVHTAYNITENHSICVGDSYDWHGQTLTTAGTYSANYQTQQGCDSIYTLHLIVNPAQRTLEVKVFLEGLYSGNGLMNQAQNVSGPQFGTDIADHVTIELHDVSYPFTIKYEESNINLFTNGLLTIPTLPCNISGLKYLVIKHRNSIETWSSSPVDFNAVSPIIYDFTTDASRAFGNNQTVFGIEYALWGGDINQDGVVDGSDMAAVDNASTPPSLIGYYPEDVNGDGVVDGSDMAIIDNNSTPPTIQIKRP